MAEKDFKEFVTDLCSDMSWKDLMRKWIENIGALIPFSGQYFAANMSSFEHELQLRAIKKMVDCQDELKTLFQEFFDDFWKTVRKYEHATYPFKIFNISQIEEIRGELNWNPEFVKEYLPIKELEGVSLDRNILLKGKIGIGKTRSIFKLMERRDIETVVVVKDYVKTLGVERFENLDFQGKTLLLWDDIQNTSEEFLKALPYLKTKDLLIVSAIRSTDYEKIEKDATIREGRFFREIDLGLYERERMEQFVRLCEKEFRKPLTDDLRGALVEKAIRGDSTPLYAASIFLKEEITKDVIDKLPGEVVKLWGGYFRDLTSNEKCFMKALRAVKLGLSPPFMELVQELYSKAFFGEQRDLADTVASLKREHWIVEIPGYYVCLDVQLECFQFEEVDWKHYLKCLFEGKLVLEHHLQLLLGVGSHYFELGKYDFALRLMDRALELKLDYTPAWYNKGIALEKLGRYEEEITCCDEALKIDPQYAPAWSNKGAALENLGRHEEAATCYDRALKIDPQYALPWYNKGVVLGKLGRYEEEITCYDEALKINPQDALAWHGKGVALGKLGRHEEAIECFDKALKIDPQYASAWSNRGVVLENLGRHEEAITCCDEALKINPQFAPAWYCKGASLEKLGRYEEAITCCDEALKINPQFAPASYNKGVVLEDLGRHEEAVTCYDEALKIDPQFALAWANKGGALGNLGRYEEAITCYDEALKVNPQDALAWLNKGGALENLGRYEEAATCYDEALKVNPQDALAWHGKGVALGKLGSYEEAIECFDKALKIDPQYASAWLNRGVVLGNLGRYEEAITCYDEALKIDPQYALAWYNKGGALGNLGSYEEAATCYDKALKINPKIAQA